MATGTARTMLPAPVETAPRLCTGAGSFTLVACGTQAWPVRSCDGRVWRARMLDTSPGDTSPAPRKVLCQAFPHILLFNPHISSAKEGLSLSSFHNQESKDTKRPRNLSLASGSAPLWSQRLPVPDPVSLPEPPKPRRPPPFPPCPALSRPGEADVHLRGWPGGRAGREARGLAADVLQAEAEALEKAAG